MLLTVKKRNRVLPIVAATVLAVAAVVVTIMGILGVRTNALGPVSFTSYPFTASEVSNWFPDRTAPSGGHESTSFGARTDVLRMGVDAENASPTTGFYRTEGLQRTLDSDVLTLRADLYVDSAWLDQDVRAGLWPVLHDSTGAVSSYPVIEFTTMGADDFTGWRWWDGDIGGWTNVELPYVTDGWNTLSVQLDGTTVSLFVNNELAGTYESPASVDIGAVILNNFNTAETGNDYNVYWSNFATGVPMVSPVAKDECKKSGWQAFGFSNQGQCVRYVETGKDSR